MSLLLGSTVVRKYNIRKVKYKPTVFLAQGIVERGGWQGRRRERGLNLITTDIFPMNTGDAV